MCVDVKTAHNHTLTRMWTRMAHGPTSEFAQIHTWQANATLTRPGRGHLTGYQLVQVSPWPDSHWMDNFTTYREARHRNTLPCRRAPRDKKPKRQRRKICTAPRAVCSSERVSRRAISKRLAGMFRTKRNGTHNYYQRLASCLGPRADCRHGTSHRQANATLPRSERGHLTGR